MLEELELNLKRCQAAQARRLEAHDASLVASADLDRAAREALLAIRHLDALYRIRFAAAPGRLDEWKVVSSIRWGRRAAGVE